MRYLPPVRQRRRPARGFTLLELMVASAIFLLVLGLVFTITNQTSKLWKSTNAKISTFQGARAAFDALTRSLGQATLNHGYDYYDSSWKRREAGATTFTPAHYGRWSDLRYLSGPAADVLPSGGADRVTHAAFFQAPLGRVEDADKYAESAGLMNAIGFHVEYADPADYEPRPQFMNAPSNGRKRFLLLQTIQPSEALAIYDPAKAGTNSKDWITRALASDQTRVMAENVVALVIMPMKEPGIPVKSGDFAYDSFPLTYDPEISHLLPPMLQVTLVAIDEDSAARLQQVNGGARPNLVPAGAFKAPSAFEADLDDLKKTLNGDNGGPRLNYRVFTSTIQTKEKR
jgi:uncharacterized protein (TIGR02599 family)